MDNKNMDYKVPESSNIRCPSYFSSAPLRRWNVHDYAQQKRLENSSAVKFATLSEQFYNGIEAIRKSKETPADVKCLLNSILPKIKNSKGKERAHTEINNQYSQCAISKSGNASFNFNPPAPKENSDPSGSNTSEQGEMRVQNKGKRKATEIEESSELSDDDCLDSLFKHPTSTNVPTPTPTPTPSEFRRLVYLFASKALSKNFCMKDAFELRKLINAFNPTTLGEQLDLMSAKLSMSIDLTNINEVNALKLSLSHIIDTVNNEVMCIYRKHLDSQILERINNLNMNIDKGLSTTAKKLCHAILAKGTINGIIKKKELRIGITEEKLLMLKSDNTESMQILDILELITKHCITDRSIPTNDDVSELTYYRKFAKILDEILDDSMLDIVDGEKVSSASKSVAKNLKKTYEANIPLTGFGRRIDLILATKNVELSTSEWKKKKTPAATCLQQQAKNIRINKAILRHFLDLPLSEIDKNKIMTVGMDWTGTMGYMFVVKPFDGVFVSKNLSKLTMPTYIDELPAFVDTLDSLYAWRNYHVRIKGIILAALNKREEEKFFSSVFGSSATAPTDGTASPNLYLTPTRPRQRKAEFGIQEGEEYEEEYEEDRE